LTQVTKQGFLKIGESRSRNVEQLRKLVDKDKWATEPAVVNAFYNPNKNDIGEMKFVVCHWHVFSRLNS
jgi:hypothetical protein